MQRIEDLGFSILPGGVIMEIVIKWAGINYGLDFLIAFIGGGFILILFCYERFAQPVQKNESFVSTL